MDCELKMDGVRAIVIVMDSVGIGELPDAAAYGDQGSNTVGNIARQVPLKLATLRGLGLGNLVKLDPERTDETAETAKSAENNDSAVSAISAVSSDHLTVRLALGRSAWRARSGRRRRSARRCPKSRGTVSAHPGT